MKIYACYFAGLLSLSLSNCSHHDNSPVLPAEKERIINDHLRDVLSDIPGDNPALGPNDPEDLKKTNTSQIKLSKQECRRESACSIISESCCDCRWGGRNIAVTVKNKRAIQSSRLEECKETVCPAVISNDKSCKVNKAVCKNSICELAY